MSFPRAEASRRPTYALPWSLAAVLALAALVRCWGLGKESLWLDEATSLIIARMDVRSVVAWAAADVHPPLYYLALHFWTTLGDSEAWIRALSALIGTLTVGVVFALGRELLDERVGLTAAVLLALSPLHVWYSQETRMYVMVTLLSLTSTYLLLLGLRRWQVRYWAGYSLLATLSLYTHYFALFVLLFQGLYALCALLRSGRTRREWSVWFASVLAIALLFAPWVPVLYHQVTTGGGGWVERSIGRPPVRALVDTWIYFGMGLHRQFYSPMLRRMAYVALAGLCLGAVVDGFRRRRSGTLFAVLYVALPLAVVWLLSQFKPMYTVRYLIPFLPAYCIVLAAGVQSCPWPPLRVALLVSLAAVLVVGNWGAFRTLQNPDWRGVTAAVLQQAEAGDVVLFSPRWNAKPFEYYARGRIATSMDLPIPVTASAAEQVVGGLAARKSRVWLIWERGHYSDPQGLAKQALEERVAASVTNTFLGNELLLYDLRGIEGAVTRDH